MPLRKITIDNNVNYIAKSEQSQERDSKPKTRTNNSILRKQDKDISQNTKKVP